MADKKESPVKEEKEVVAEEKVVKKAVKKVVKRVIKKVKVASAKKEIEEPSSKTESVSKSNPIVDSTPKEVVASKAPASTPSSITEPVSAKTPITTPSVENDASKNVAKDAPRKTVRMPAALKDNSDDDYRNNRPPHRTQKPYNNQNKNSRPNPNQNKNGRPYQNNNNRNFNSRGRGPRLTDEQKEPIIMPPEGEYLHIKALKQKTITELNDQVIAIGLPDFRGADKQSLIYKIVEDQAAKDVPIFAEGVLEMLPDGYGFLRSPDHSYLPGQDDIYISPRMSKLFNLRTGDTVSGLIRLPREGERYFALQRVEKINYDNPEECKKKIPFKSLVPIFPDSKINLESAKDTYTTRIMDMFVPMGKGQRGLIVAPPRTGKTVLLKDIAHSIEKNHPESILMVLLVDERPEEVTDMERSVKGEVIASTFDEPPERHVQVAENVIERARRLVEHGNDVIILLDSITRLARAYNTVVPHSGKILSGGVDSTALQKPKAFFGAARNIEHGGSLTIIATALVETGSRMDEVIFEEFKGTGNSEIILDRQLSDKRVYPALDINRSGTRRDDLLHSEEELNRVTILRQFLSDQTTLEALNFVLGKVKQNDTNKAFLSAMNG